MTALIIYIIRLYPFLHLCRFLCPGDSNGRQESCVLGVRYRMDPKIVGGQFHLERLFVMKSSPPRDELSSGD